MSEPPAKRIKFNVVSGDGLPDLCWLKICENLNVEGRKAVRGLGKRYRDMLNATRFTRDIKLCFDHCIISPKCPPWTIFENSQLKIRNLTISENTWIHSNRSFWDSLEENIEVLTLVGNISVDRLNNILAQFKNVKKVTLNSIDQLIGLNFPETVQKIHLSGVAVNMLPNIDTAKELLKNLNGKVLTTNKIIVEGFAAGPGGQKLFKISDKIVQSAVGFLVLMVRDDLNLMQIDEVQPEDIMDLIMFAHKTLDDLKMFPNIHSFAIQSHEELTSITAMGPWKNIKSISMKLNQAGVVIDTKLIEKFKLSLPNLTTAIVKTEAPAPDCSNFLKLLPNTICGLSIESASYDVVELPNFVKLKSISINLQNYNSFKCEKMPSVKSLHIESRTEISDKNLKNFKDNFPNIELFCFRGTLSLRQLRKIKLAWPHLRRFQCKVAAKDQIEIAAELKRPYFQNLQWFNCIKKSPKQHLEVFEEIPKLRRFFSTSYKDYCVEKYNILEPSIEKI